MGYQSTAWLWWIAFFFLMIGGTVTYILSQQKTDPSARGYMSISLAITCIGFGLPVILATANWWLKR
ncbi:MAG: hypothetical protein JXB04_05385 [Kiritimatiellae bacterium]|nr:hypothetical protein [Kiritimatiellia bacterium]